MMIGFDEHMERKIYAFSGVSKSGEPEENVNNWPGTECVVPREFSSNNHFLKTNIN
jgi:hypothetical protein